METRCEMGMEERDIKMKVKEGVNKEGLYQFLVG